jgi:putative FmdB family regulatory protein
MPTYGYACATCGAFDVVRPMAAVGAPAECPGCGEPGRRLFAAPALRSLAPGLRRALDTQARSGDAPTVVTSPPPRTARRQPRVTDPRQARLPRP